MYINTGAENLTALSCIYQSDYSSVETSTLQCCVVHDVASADEADKCSISNNYLHRKRYLALHRTTTDKQCKYIVNNYVIQCDNGSKAHVHLQCVVCYYKCKHIKYRIMCIITI